MLSSPQTLAQWLHQLENLPQREIQLGLDRIHTVAKHLQLLNPTSLVITVAGTNGKGSTVTLLEAIYRQAGYKVAAYTSPHLTVYNERIRLNQCFISDEALCEAFAVIDKARGDTYLTYFEMTTLAALWFFKQSEPEVMILEVGLGGRYDATNIIDAQLAIITTIDFDHQAYLGDTIEAIAHQKAGILRSNQLAIYADRKVPQSIVNQANALGTTLFCLGRDYDYRCVEDEIELTLPSAKKLGCACPSLHPNVVAAGVLAAQLLAEQRPVTNNALTDAMQTVTIAGRQQIIYDTICTVLDVSHNPQAVRGLSEYLNKLAVKGQIHAVMSGLNDKDLCGLIKPMHSWVDHWYTAVLDNKRAASESRLLDAFDHYHLQPSIYGSIAEAYLAAKSNAVAGDVVVVYGSFFVVGPVLTEIQREERVTCNG